MLYLLLASRFNFFRCCRIRLLFNWLELKEIFSDIVILLSSKLFTIPLIAALKYFPIMKKKTIFRYLVKTQN